MYCAMIGDLIGSKKIEGEEREAVQLRLRQLLDEMNTRFSEYLASPFLVTLGDEFQGLLTAAEPALEIIEYIDRGLSKHKVRMRYGLGLGEISTGPVNRTQALGDDGPAYHYARQGVDLLKKADWRGFPVSIQTNRADASLLEAICRLLNDLTGDWSDVQRQYVLDMELLGEQLLAAEKNNVSQSSISRALKRGHYRTYQQTKETLKQYLLETYDCPESAGRLGKYNWAAFLERNRRYEEAVPILTELLELPESGSGEPPRKGDILLLLSVCQEGLGDYTAAMKSAKKAIQSEMSEREASDRRLAEMNQQLGTCYLNLSEQYEQKGEKQLAQDWAKQSISIFDHALTLCQGMPTLEVDVFANFALAYGKAGDRENEINACLELRTQAEQQNIQTEAVCANYHNLSCAYGFRKEFKKALEASEKAIQIAELLVAPPKGAGRVYLQYAKMLSMTGKAPEDLLPYVQKALAFFKRDNDFLSIQEACNFLETTYRQMDKKDAAAWAAEQRLKAERMLRKREEKQIN